MLQPAIIYRFTAMAFSLLIFFTKDIIFAIHASINKESHPHGWLSLQLLGALTDYHLLVIHASANSAEQ